MSLLAGKTALITGGARGMGAAIARAFTQEGAKVYVTDIRDEMGRQVAASLQGGAYERLDVREEADWERVMKRVTGDGRLDIVVNNAGIVGFEEHSRPLDPENVTLDDWHAIHRTTLDGVFLGCRYAIRAMRPHKAGAIVNMSSYAGMIGVAYSAAYASAKAAVRNHTKSVALYCCEQNLNIRCNSIHPGSIWTPMWETSIGGEPGRAERIRQSAVDVPMRRFGKPEEVAELAVFLASDRSSYLTGGEYLVDGGFRAGHISREGTPNGPLPT